MRAGPKAYFIIVLDSNKQQVETHLCSGHGVYEVREPSWVCVCDVCDVYIYIYMHVYMYTTHTHFRKFHTKKNCYLGILPMWSHLSS